MTLWARWSCATSCSRRGFALTLILAHTHPNPYPYPNPNPYPNPWPNPHSHVNPDQALGEGASALPSTLVFDHPTARQLAAFFEAQEAPAAPVQPISTSADAFIAAEVVIAGATAMLPQGAGSMASVWRVSAELAPATFNRVATGFLFG